MEGLEWSGRLRWFAARFSGTREAEEVAQTKGVKGNAVVAGRCTLGAAQHTHLV